jgi:hypothetical protein
LDFVSSEQPKNQANATAGEIRLWTHSFPHPSNINCVPVPDLDKQSLEHRNMNTHNLTAHSDFLEECADCHESQRKELRILLRAMWKKSQGGDA